MIQKNEWNNRDNTVELGGLHLHLISKFSYHRIGNTIMKILYTFFKEKYSTLQKKYYITYLINSALFSETKKKNEQKKKIKVNFKNIF